MSGGEADGVRLLRLARRELLEQVLPELSGEALYRARLIAKAMKIAAQELQTGPGQGAETTQQLATFAQARAGLAGTAVRQGEADPQETLRRALRAGTLDGDSALYELLCGLSEQRRRILG